MTLLYVAQAHVRTPIADFCRRVVFISSLGQRLGGTPLCP
jgi:hypothetical protein